MDIHSTHRRRLQQNSLHDIDLMLRDMAKRDGYDARKIMCEPSKLPITDRLLHDVSPCEQEQPDIIVTEWVPESQHEKDYFSACVVCVCIATGIAIALWAWLTN